MKTYVITLSKRFPAGHRRAGDLTFFHEKLANALDDAEATLTVDDADDTPIQICDWKIHTMRVNYPLWEKRIAEVERARLAYQSDNGWASHTTANRLKLPG